MNKLIIFVGFLVLLLVPLRSAGEDFPDRSDISTGLEVEEDEGDDEFELSEWPSSCESARTSKTVINVESFGAVGDGESDDTQAFVNAWKKACSSTKAVLLVPQGHRYLVSATKFSGPCADKLVIQIDGTIVAPQEPSKWDSSSPRTWLVFNNLSRVTFQGGGTIDGSGSKWWAESCKKDKSKPCKGAPTALTIDLSSAVRMKGLTIQNGQQMNLVLSHSNSVRLFDVKVSAPENSPNTDGIHITGSKNVVLQNCQIGTGDDCVSIVNGSSNIKLKNINCGPGHGISIGSLGKDNSYGTVEKVVVDTAFLRRTSNGLRIKTWQGGEGDVTNVRYSNIQMVDVANPIIIDQYYCDSPTPCQNQTSAVKISQIMYQNISGTSKGKRVMNFACSDIVPCTNIILNNINLQTNDGSPAETYCHSAAGIINGDIQPSAECLLSSSHKDQIIMQNTEAQTGTQHLIHTEL